MMNTELLILLLFTSALERFEGVKWASEARCTLFHSIDSPPVAQGRLNHILCCRLAERSKRHPRDLFIFLNL